MVFKIVMVGGMKRLGLRSSSLSTETNADAGTKISQTIEPQLFYDRVLGTVILVYQSF